MFERVVCVQATGKGISSWRAIHFSCPPPSFLHHFRSCCSVPLSLPYIRRNIITPLFPRVVLFPPLIPRAPAPSSVRQNFAITLPSLSLPLSAPLLSFSIRLSFPPSSLLILTSARGRSAERRRVPLPAPPYLFNPPSARRTGSRERPGAINGWITSSSYSPRSYTRSVLLKMCESSTYDDEDPIPPFS